MATPRIEPKDGEVWMDMIGRRIQIIHMVCPDWKTMAEVRLAGEVGTSYISPFLLKNLLIYKIGN